MTATSPKGRRCSEISPRVIYRKKQGWEEASWLRLKCGWARAFLYLSQEAEPGGGLAWSDGGMEPPALFAARRSELGEALESGQPLRLVGL